MGISLGTYYSSNPQYLEGSSEIEIPIVTNGVLVVTSSREDKIKKPDVTIEFGDGIIDSRDFSNAVKRSLWNLETDGESQISVKVIMVDEDGDPSYVGILFYIGTYAVVDGKATEGYTPINLNSRNMEKEMGEAIELGIEDLYDEIADVDLEYMNDRY